MNHSRATPPSSTTVFQILRSQILSGVLAPGASLNEVVLAQQLGVSHTPVREAIKDLVGQGFVEAGSNRRRHVARYSPRRAAEIVQLQGLLYRYSLLRIAEVAAPAEIDDLASAVTTAAAALSDGDALAIHQSTAAVVEAICRAARDTALAVALPRASERGFALALLPAEAWQLWRDWSHTMARFADLLRAGQVVQVAEEYFAAESVLATEISRRWPEPGGDPESEVWSPPTVIGQTRAEAVAAYLRAEIFASRLRQGEPIRETELAHRCGVSTTPVREAIRLLAGEGLIEIGTNRRRVVASRTEQQLADLLRLTHHLVRWQAEQGLPGMSEAAFATLQLRATVLARHVDANSAGLSDDFLGFWGSLAAAAGNREVWTVARSGLLSLLTQWAHTASPLGENADLYRRIAHVPYDDERTRAVLRLIDELARTVQRQADLRSAD